MRYTNPSLTKLSFLIFLILILLTTNSSLCLRDNTHNVDTSTCQYMALENGKFVNVKFKIDITLIDQLMIGSWSDQKFIMFALDSDWNSSQPIVRNNYSFNGKRLEFDAKRDYEDQYGNTSSFSADAVIIFSDDFEFIEKFSANWESNSSLGNSYFNTHLELINIPYSDYCFLDPNVVKYNIGGTKTLNTERKLSGDNIIEFYSQGDYYLNGDGNSEWNFNGLHNISDDLPFYPEFEILIADEFYQ